MVFITSLFLIPSAMVIEKVLSEEFLSKLLFKPTYIELEKQLKESNVSKEKFKEVVCSFLKELELNIQLTNITIKCEEFNDFDEFVSIVVNKSIMYTKSSEVKCKNIEECLKERDLRFLFQIPWRKIKIYAIMISISSLLLFIILSRNMKEITRKIGLSLLFNSLIVLVPIYLIENNIISFELPLQMDISDILSYSKNVFNPFLITGAAILLTSFIFKKKK
ncbi:MAG: hypothetical protein RMJ17_03245 [Candidatus Aenigmarchaeota archaeon]|nr:hypothetical protein [Candidatus Aenigmarchaeota archaeon]MDW8149582.1 hypothetical protein [Candidatus Aenigmarchaeota archaeon]